MRTGYLSIETHADHSGLIRLVLGDEAPDPVPDAARAVRYIARFNDSEAALMHTHELLKRRLLDLDGHLYRVPLERAIAAVESLDLRHRRVYLDPDLADDLKRTANELTKRYRRRRQLRDRMFQAIGYLALGLLLFNLLFLSTR